MNIFLDKIPIGTSIGLDFNYFQLPASKPFFGFKHVPKYDGKQLHVLHFQHDDNGMRYGYWINAERIRYCSFMYDTEKEMMVPDPESGAELGIDVQATYQNRFEQCQHLMIEYPDNEDAEQWQQLVNQIRWKEVAHWCDFCGSEELRSRFAYVDSSMTSVEESNLVNRSVRDTHQSLILAPANESMLRYTPIRFKDQAALRPDHRMQDFLDKSWYLCHVILVKYHYSNLRSLLGELQFCYLNSVLFANYGSSLQWHNIVELLCFSRCLTEERFSAVAEELDGLLCLQTRRVPDEYKDTLLHSALLARCATQSHAPLPAWKKLLRSEEARDIDYSSRDDGLSCSESDQPHHEDSSEDEFAPTVVEQTVYRPRDP